MTAEMFFTFGLLLITMLLFVTEWLRLDITALLVVLTLIVTGLLTPNEALAGFADPIVLMIAGLFVVGNGLYRTGLAHALGRALTRIGGQSEPRLVALTMLTAAILSAFMNSSGATAILIPVVVSLAWRAKVSPSKLLLPLAIGSLVGGLLTLIGTPPNLIVNSELTLHGLRPFGFFTFTPVGIVLVGVSIGFMVVIGRHWLPAQTRAGSLAGRSDDEALSLEELAVTYKLPDNLFRLRVRAASPLVDMTLAEADLRARYHVNVLEIESWAETQKPLTPARPVEPTTVLTVNAVLHVQGTPQAVTHLAHSERLGIMSNEEGAGPLLSQEIGMVELLLTPRSRLIGQTLPALRFRDRYQVTVLSLRRLGETVTDEMAALRLRFGDTLLVLGTWNHIALLQQEHHDFVVVGQPREMFEAQHSPRRAWTAAIIMVLMLLLMSFNVIPGVVAVLGAAVAMVLTDCLTMEQAYESINWQNVVLMAGMLPLATVLQKTGGVQIFATALNQGLGPLGPIAVLAGLFVLTGVCSQFISNTAATVLMAPIAYQAALTLGIAPHAFLMGVAVATSTAFATPVATLSSTLVMAPGGYRTNDYVKLGIGLQTVLLVVCLILLPLLFPF